MSEDAFKRWCGELVEELCSARLQVASLREQILNERLDHDVKLMLVVEKINAALALLESHDD